MNSKKATSAINNSLVLTLDYELFGDGSGNVFTHIIEPTKQILDVCNDIGIKITIFFEAVEYIKLKQYWDAGNCMGYSQNPISAIEDQIQTAVRDGHDIQLHIHPQWVNAEYRDNRWKIDYSYWRLGAFDKHPSISLEDLISDCINAIQNVVRPEDPHYSCIALRAGGYNIMPSNRLFEIMTKFGIKMDSSVYPGGYEKSPLSAYDYRHISVDPGFWWASPIDITIPTESRTQILEFPIFALPIPNWKRLFNYSRIRSLLTSPTSALSANSAAKLSQKSFSEKIRFLFESQAVAWDVCSFRAQTHRAFFSYISNYLRSKRSYYVLIGHPKNMKSVEDFRSFLDLASKHTMSFKTLRHAYNEIAG